MTDQRTLWPEFLKALRHEVVPALGCTEPISLALASAIAARHLGAPPERIDARVSANLMKNGMGVTVPGTGMVGLPIAAAVGALGGDADGGLEVLRRLTPAVVDAGKRMLAEKKVAIEIADLAHVLYAESRVSRGADWVRVCIADSHTQVVLIEKNGETLFSAPAVDTATTRELRCSRVIPSDVSSRVTAFDTLAFDRPSDAAAAVKLPPSATATKQAQPS